MKTCKCDICGKDAKTISYSHNEYRYEADLCKKHKKQFKKEVEEAFQEMLGKYHFDICYSID